MQTSPSIDIEVKILHYNSHNDNKEDEVTDA